MASALVRCSKMVCARRNNQTMGTPTLASSLMQARVKKLSKHRQSNTDFCRCRCLPSSGCPKIVWATSCCGLTATEAHDLHRQGDRTQLVVTLYTSCSWLSNKIAEIKNFWPLLFAMSCGRVTVNLIGQMVGHRECWRQCSAVGKWGVNARGWGSAQLSCNVGWMCWGRLSRYPSLVGSLSGWS